MYSITKNTEESKSLQPPDLKPALQLFEETISNTIIKWFNHNNKINNKESLVYNHLLNNPMVVGLSLQITKLENQLSSTNAIIDKLKKENEQLKNRDDSKNVTLDISEIPSPNNTVNIPDSIIDENQTQLNQLRLTTPIKSARPAN